MMGRRIWKRARTIAGRLARGAAALFVLLGLPWPAPAATGKPPVSERVERLRQQLRAEAASSGAESPVAGDGAEETGESWTDWDDWDDWSKWANLP